MKPFKAHIRTNVWGNWYGYLGSKRIISFFNSPTETQEQAAKRWLKEVSDRPCRASQMDAHYNFEQ